MLFHLSKLNVNGNNIYIISYKFLMRVSCWHPMLRAHKCSIKGTSEWDRVKKLHKIILFLSLQITSISKDVFQFLLSQ